MTVYVIVVDPGGILSASFDRDLAHRAAEATEAVVVELPIAADYRRPPEGVGSTSENAR